MFGFGLTGRSLMTAAVSSSGDLIMDYGGRHLVVGTDFYKNDA
jgi:hypothetical protein